MKRLHVHVSVNDLDASVRFYAQLSAAHPSVQEQDYARWILDDARVNFAISQRDGRSGVQHESTVHGTDEIRPKTPKEANAACCAPSCRFPNSV